MSDVNVLARVSAATVLALAAPAVSFLLTPAGFAVTLIVTVLVTAVAAALGARIAGRAGFSAIRFVLAWWAVIGFAVTVAGVSLGRTQLTEFGIAFLVAALTGMAVGLSLCLLQD